ncbi:MAG: N-acetyltransferase [Lysobacteraceae bacterium]|nr:MAG: N-acetyltransferase [Xanthomonadaceae bacterium]
MKVNSVNNLSGRTLNDLAQCLWKTVEGGASIGFLEPFSLAEAKAYWCAVAEQLNEDLHLLVASDNGRAVGAVQLLRCSRANGRHRGEVQKLLIDPDYRGQGLAAQLLQALESEAKELGLTLLVLDTEFESVAERLYQRLGWQRVGAIPNYALSPDGEPVTTVYYYKELHRGSR